MLRRVDCERAVWIEFPVRNCQQGILRGNPEGVQLIGQFSELVLLFDGRWAFTTVEGGAPCDPDVPGFEFAFERLIWHRPEPEDWIVVIQLFRKVRSEVMGMAVLSDNSAAGTVPPSEVRDHEVGGRRGGDGLNGHRASVIPPTGRVNVNGAACRPIRGAGLPFVLCARSHVGGEDVVRVTVQVLACPVVAHGGAWVGVPGGDLDVPQVYPGVQHGGHVRVPQHVRMHPR
jgi:hypothetical protein